MVVLDFRSPGSWTIQELELELDLLVVFHGWQLGMRWDWGLVCASCSRLWYLLHFRFHYHYHDLR